MCFTKEFLDSRNCGACALTRAGKVSITSLSSKAQALLQAAGSEPSSFVLVPLSKIETLLLASLGGKGKNRYPLACLRNAGFHSADSYCMLFAMRNRFETTKTDNKALWIQ